MPVIVPHTNPPPTHAVVQPPAIHTNEFPELWVSLNRWAQLRSFNPARRLALSDCVAFGVHTSTGELILQADSLIAYWDDVQIHLGFAPKLIGGQLFVHRLDVIKNLEPLLHEPTTARTNRVIVLDPGHGGSNTGTQSAIDGQPEKTFTLDWAERLAPMLVTNGWTVYLTRTSDVDVSLADRVVFAEAHHADLFVSLHFNSAAPDDREAGLETYCLTPNGMPSALTRDYADDVTDVYPNNSYDTESWGWAFQLQRAILRPNLLGDRGVRRARFMGVLRGQMRAAVLIEGGYLSNPAEARRIADPAFRQKLAEAVANALK
jgi:N-acetylmuramoyl-L-alanine amidase